MEKPFDKLDGVVATVSGYTGGEEQNPTYRSVSARETHHLEAVQVCVLATPVAAAPALALHHLRSRSAAKATPWQKPVRVHIQPPLFHPRLRKLGQSGAAVARERSASSATG